MSTTGDPPEPPHEPAPQLASLTRRMFRGPEGLRAGWSVLLFLLIAGIILVAGFSLLRLLSPATLNASTASGLSAWRIISAETIQLAAVLIATWLMAKFEKRRLTSYGLGGERRASRFLAGSFWGFLFISLLVLILWLSGHIQITGSLLSLADDLRFGFIWFGAMLLVGLFEESFVRGYLLFTLSRGMGFWWAALLLSVIFGAGHGRNPGESPIGLFAAGLIGLVFCLSIWYTQSLWWAIGFHTAWDWGETFFYGTPNSGVRAQGHLLTARPVGNLLMSGGATGPEGSWFILPFILLIATVVYWTLRKDSRLQDS